jgi:excisionase family DNA binding protein
MTENTNHASEPDSPWWRVRDAARHARCGPKIIYRAVASGQLRAVRLGGRRELRLRPDWVDSWLEAQLITTEGDSPER